MYVHVQALAVRVFPEPISSLRNTECYTRFRKRSIP